MIDWQDEIVEDLARRRAILVIGSGVSRHSHGISGRKPPTWKEFLNQATADCPNKADMGPIESALKAGDFLHACEWLKKDLMKVGLII